jgi:hypothetical protein
MRAKQNETFTLEKFNESVAYMREVDKRF